MSITNSADSLGAKADAAFRQAAVDVIAIARRTGTPVIVWEDGRIVHWSPDEAERKLAEKIGRQSDGAQASSAHP